MATSSVDGWFQEKIVVPRVLNLEEHNATKTIYLCIDYSHVRGTSTLYHLLTPPLSPSAKSL